MEKNIYKMKDDCENNSYFTTCIALSDALSEDAVNDETQFLEIGEKKLLTNKSMGSLLTSSQPSTITLFHGEKNLLLFTIASSVSKVASIAKW